METTSIFVAMCALILWAHPLQASAADVGAALRQSLAPSLACGVAFYVTRLYDLRTVPTFSRFASRLPRSLALAVGLLAGASLLHPHRTLGEACLGLAALGLVLPLRVVSYDVLFAPPPGGGEPVGVPPRRRATLKESGDTWGLTTRDLLAAGP